MITMLFLHTLAHLGNGWRASLGPYGWWVWHQAPNVQDGFGFARGHFIAAFETR